MTIEINTAATPPGRSARIAAVCGLSDTGPVRSKNEDRYLADEALGLLCVADGMGGHPEGEMASAAALELLRDYLLEAQAAGASSTPLSGFNDGVDADPDATRADQRLHGMRLLFEAIERANARIYRRNHDAGLPEGAGMGTTLTGVWCAPDSDTMLSFHVGDSRIYRYRAAQLELLTRDQTSYQLALESGAVEHLPAQNLLLQAVGPAASVMPEVRVHAMLEGDVLLVCSDGLHGCVPHGDIEDALSRCTPQSLAPACEELVALAKEHGGRDNITVLLACFHQP